MDDQDIVALYWAREEAALCETKKKYGKLLHSVTYGILHCREDAEECENDTYLRAWNTIPPAAPYNLSAFLIRLARNISISKYRTNHAKKRGGGEIILSLNELQDCLSTNAEQEIQGTEQLTELINTFLQALPPIERQIFVCRYFSCMSIQEIASSFQFGQSKIKMMLMRTREKLRIFLEKEGYKNG